MSEQQSEYAQNKHACSKRAVQRKQLSELSYVSEQVNEKSKRTVGNIFVNSLQFLPTVSAEAGLRDSSGQTHRKLNIQRLQCQQLQKSDKEQK